MQSVGSYHQGEATLYFPVALSVAEPGSEYHVGVCLLSGFFKVGLPVSSVIERASIPLGGDSVLQRKPEALF